MCVCVYIHMHIYKAHVLDVINVNDERKKITKMYSRYYNFRICYCKFVCCRSFYIQYRYYDFFKMHTYVHTHPHIHASLA